MEIKTKTETTPELERLLPARHRPHSEPAAGTDTGGSYSVHLLIWVTVLGVLVYNHVSPLCRPEVRCGK